MSSELNPGTMHLPNTVALQLEAFFGNDAPPYAILSHVRG